MVSQDRERPRVPEPKDGDERSLLLGWLGFQRDALVTNCAGLNGDELAARSAPPSSLSLLGLVRHLTEMERVYGSWALGPPGPLVQVWGEYTDDGPEWDFDAIAAAVPESMAAWEKEKAATDSRIRALGDLAEPGANRRSARWNLSKLVGEYARHNGHADLLRERIDGAVGE